MIVSDLHQMLSYGELSNLAMSDEGSGTITAAARPRITLYANEALIRLYSRFVLKEQDVLIQMFEHITFYHLLPRFGVNYTPAGDADNEPVRYILDLPHEFFAGDIIRITQVYESVRHYPRLPAETESSNDPFDGARRDPHYLHAKHCHGRGRLPLNDDNDPRSVFTPQANVLQVPQPVQGEALSVLYQAKHAPLHGSLDQLIEIPDVLLSALTSYVAYKVFDHMNTQDSIAKAQEYMGLYELICSGVTDRDLVNSSIATSNTRFQKRGWA